jgi:hypothetical protein
VNEGLFRAQEIVEVTNDAVVLDRRRSASLVFCFFSLFVLSFFLATSVRGLLVGASSVENDRGKK